MNRPFLITLSIGTFITLYFIFSNSHRSQPRIVLCSGKNVQFAYIRLADADLFIVKKGLPLYAERCLNRQLPYFDRTVELLINARTVQSKSKKPPFPTFTIKKTFLIRPSDTIVIKDVRLHVTDSSIILQKNNQRKVIPFPARDGEKDEYVDLTY